MLLSHAVETAIAAIILRPYAPEEARDLTQGFFLHLFEHKTLARADPLKGKFRSFLLGSLQNYLSTETDRARCLKRWPVKFIVWTVLGSVLFLQ
jgi:hypothetical protein